MIFKKVSIVGLGLIGGSLAKAIKRSHPKCCITVMDRNKDSLQTALKEKIADKGTTSIEEGVKDGDIVFLCTPLNTIPYLMGRVWPLLKPNAILTDVGSTKGDIMDRARGLSEDEGPIFIGGHPMAGAQHAGYSAALPHLFENAYYILTPLGHTPSWVIKSFSKLLTSVGALPLVIDPESHDSIVGAVSHLPHVVASALVNAVSDLDNSVGLYGKLAAGGFRDITRIASSSPQMWKFISLANRKELDVLMASMVDKLEEFSGMLNQGEEQGIEEFFSRAKNYRDNLPARQSLNLMAHYELYVDVEDRPGIIGEVTTILGNANININNLRIIHSREGIPGSLVITLPDAKALEGARNVLTENGYPCFIQ